MTIGPTSIRTPDQLLRVFVSSTLRELADERKAVRSAIERMRLAPVMFELGARPHPPRDLYRAYLQRSEIFLGIYWLRYGWVAPDETVSGLEDEYNLAPASMPRLIYIKSSDEAPEPRLAALLQRIKNDDRASYKSFDTVEELEELVEADLATLLAERFDAAMQAASDDRSGPADAARGGLPVGSESIPAPLTALLGREKELGEVGRMLRDGARLVTLTGPGGIGKSRLAMEIGRSLAADFPDGVFFVALAAAQDEGGVRAALAEALGVRDTGIDSLEDALVTALRGRKLLIVADNFEQVVEASGTLTTLLSALPELSFLVTSRTVLRVLGEHRVEVGPLPLPGVEATTPESALRSPAVQLFVQRARSLRPDFEVTEDNVAAVVAICAELEGVPLALELAAASIRLFPPAALLTRLQQHRPLPSTASSSLPSRQRSLQSTIEWSVRLLEDRDTALLYRLGVFSGGFSLAAAEAVAGADLDDLDVLDALGALVDASLIRQQDRGDHAFFTLLASVQRFARARLEESGMSDETRDRHARYYLELARTSAPLLRGREQDATALLLVDEKENLRAVVRYFIERREWDLLARLAWDLYVYWWLKGLLGEVRGWMGEMLDSGEPIAESSRAVALYYTRAITFWQEADGRVIPGLTESADLFHSAGDASGEALARASIALALLAATPPNADDAGDKLERALTLFRSNGDAWGETLALVTLGRVAFLEQKLHRALNRFDESLVLARQQGDHLSAAIAVNHLGWAHLMLGEAETAREEFTEGLRSSSIAEHAEGIAYGLEGLVASAAVAGDAERAGQLLGASEVLRERTGLYNVPTFSFHQQALAPILASDAAEAFAAARQRGRALSSSAAVDLALHDGVATATTTSTDVGVDTMSNVGDKR
jgi:predicted ATPase